MLVLQKRPPREVATDVMVYLGKQREVSFRCPCGCNVFRHPNDRASGKLIMNRYVCNSCGEQFEGS